MACAYGEDSAHLVYPRSMIRIFHTEPTKTRNSDLQTDFTIYSEQMA